MRSQKIATLNHSLQLIINVGLWGRFFHLQVIRAANQTNREDILDQITGRSR